MSFDMRPVPQAVQAKVALQPRDVLVHHVEVDRHDWRINQLQRRPSLRGEHCGHSLSSPDLAEDPQEIASENLADGIV